MVEESHFDGQVAATGFDNVIIIQHDDGTTALRTAPDPRWRGGRRR
jgi:hypothetical protein